LKLRFKIKDSHKKKDQKVGNRRIKRRFLFFPKTLPIDTFHYQTRWLEEARWEEIFSYSVGGLTEDGFYWWHATGWIDD
jgi:hypothetical protein